VPLGLHAITIAHGAGLAFFGQMLSGAQSTKETAVYHAFVFPFVALACGYVPHSL